MCVAVPAPASASPIWYRSRPFQPKQAFIAAEAPSRPFPMSLSLLLLAVALSMDVFAAALSRGVATASTALLRTALTVGLAVGVAHGVMPLIGWSLTSAMAALVRDLDHWIAFILLALIGVRMFRQSRDGSSTTGREGGASLLALAFATSIDAAVVGGTFAGLGQPVAVACVVLAAVAFMFAVAGVYLGKVAGDALGSRAQAAGGLLLIALAIKIVVDHEFFGG